MNNHLYYVSLDRTSLGDEYAKLEDLKYFVREEIEPDVSIAAKFPISYFGSLGEDLVIRGSKGLVEAFNAIYAEKIDLVETLESVEYIGLTDKNEIILNFKNDGLKASGVYDFTNEFFEEMFSMGKFASFCIKHDYTDLLRDNLHDLFVKLKENEKQYRLLMKGDELFLRGLTSNRYQNYDNNVALYIALLSIHKFAKENGLLYSVVRARLSDSAINVFFEQDKPVNIPGIGKLYFGIFIANSEVRDSAFSFEIRYRLVDNDEKASFAALPDLRNSVFNINHITGLERIEDRIKNISNLSAIQKSMITLISELKDIKILSGEAMYRIFQKIVYSKNFKSETKQKFKELYEQYDVDNAYGIIQAFDKINSITADIDERVFLERIYHELITELTDRKKRAG